MCFVVSSTLRKLKNIYHFDIHVYTFHLYHEYRKQYMIHPSQGFVLRHLFSMKKKGLYQAAPNYYILFLSNVIFPQN